MSDRILHVVAGLGNPGDKYGGTRHNVGFFVVDALSSEYSIPLDRRKFDTFYGRGTVKGEEVILIKPQSYMNRSGVPICRFIDYFEISHRNMLIIHDDIDLIYGRIKIKAKGGHGGHNGVRSIIDTLGDDNFTRLRVGIGRSENESNVTGHVLGRFRSDEKKLLEQIVARSRDAAVTILCEGTKEGMNRFNERTIQPSS
jgi:peptidyl-tRNA hydrolase, PTH1 family